MVAMITSANTFKNKVEADKSAKTTRRKPLLAKPGRQARAFVELLARDYPQFKFTPGEQENWSPKTKTITYSAGQSLEKLRYGTLHELAHAMLGHTDYKSDFELLKLESKAWELAACIGKKYKVIIDDEHIQNCLDTYRDWLHRRSTCPACKSHVLQDSSNSYKCFNCGTSWQVSARRFGRSYRRKQKLPA